MTVAKMRPPSGVFRPRIRTRNHHVRTLLALGALLLLAALSASTGLATAISNIGLAVTSGFAAILCFRATRLRGTDARPWTLIGTGCLVWFAGQLIWGLNEIGIGNASSYPSIAEIVSLGLFPCVAAGVLLIIRREMEQTLTVELLLDTSIVIAVMVTFLFKLLPTTFLDRPEGGNLARVFALAWQAETFGLLVLAVIALIWCSSMLRRGPLASLIVGLLLFMLGNILHGSVATEGVYYSDAFICLVWAEGFIFVAVAAVLASSRNRRDDALAQSHLFQRSAQIRAGLIVVSVSTLAAVASFTALQEQRDVVVAVAVAVVGLLMTMRIGYASIQSEWLDRRTRERDRLAGVVAASAAIAGTLDIDELLPRLAAAAADAVGRERVEVYVYDEHRIGIEATGVYGFSPEELRAIAALATIPVGAFRAERDTIATHKPIIQWTDAAELPLDLAAGFRRIGKRKALLAPLLAHDEVIGVIDLWTPGDSNAFEPADIAAAAAIGQQAGLAVYNARLLAKTRQHVDEQAALLRVSQVAISRLDLPRLANEIAMASLGIANAECCAIEILHPDSGETEMIAQAYAPDWIGPNHIGKRYPLAVWQSTAHVIERREPLNARVTDPVFTPHEQNALSTDGTRSVLVVPLLLGDEALGIMTLFARNDTLFSESEVRVGLKLAAQVSLAIDRARLHDALRQRADTDGLTGVLNHRAILEVLQHEVARSQRSGDPFAVMMIDLDDFKKVNDAHGHQAGDEVLVATAELLRGIIRDVDRIGRYGGDEFLLVMPGVDLGTGSQVAERLITQIEQHAFQYNDSRMKVGLSIGIAVYPPDGVTDRELVMQADNAMYRHKISRRARAIPEHKLVVSIAPDPITASQAS